MPDSANAGVASDQTGRDGQSYFPRRSFFIVGAPRCGTTALYRALQKNPQICLARPKEAHFFARPGNFKAQDDAARYYLRTFFSHLNENHRVIGEGSVSYLYSEDVIRRITALDPAAKFIVMVRNPVDMVPSYHNRLVYLLDEDVKDFAKAWAMQERRMQGLDIPKRCRDPRLLYYGESGQHAKYLERLFKLVGRDRCHVIVFDDFMRSSGECYKDVLRFLAVDYDGLKKVKKRNRTRRFKNAWLQQFVANPPKLLTSLIDLDALRKSQFAKNARLRIMRMNTYRHRPAPVDPAIRQMLHAHFAEDIGKLSVLLGRDLSHWR